MHVFIYSLFRKILECRLKWTNPSGILTHNIRAKCVLIYFSSCFTYTGFNVGPKKLLKIVTGNKVKSPNKSSCLSSGSVFIPFVKSTGKFNEKGIGPRIRRLQLLLYTLPSLCCVSLGKSWKHSFELCLLRPCPAYIR